MDNVLLIIAGVIFGIVSLLMIVAILLQEGKGGGLAALGGTRAESAFGASNPLRKMTAILSVIFLVLAGGLSLALRPEEAELKKEPKADGVEAVVDIPAENEKKTPAPAPAPAPAPTPAPEPAKETPKTDGAKPVSEKPAGDAKTPPAKPEAGK
ncbi:MAG TPA: preprotein translocase subunit SecG [Planctomycetota bacterium]|nr:preprotein translocase subunit SecG [Planctomycetota bacterium]